MAEKANEQISKPTDDEITQTMVENYENEIEQFEKALESKIKAKARFEKQWERDKEIWNLKLAGAEKITPTYKFEENPRYWELMRDVINDQVVQDTFMSEAKIKEFDDSIEALKEQIQSNKDALTKLKE